MSDKAFKGLAISRSKYPFAEMEVGDEVFFLGGYNTGPEHASAVKVGVRSERKFSTRKAPNGLYIKRIA